MLLVILALVALLLLVNARWVSYVAHLARHQLAVITGKQAITKLLADPTLAAETRAHLVLVGKIRAFTEERYEMQKSHSYETFYDLKRDYLGYNITVAPEFSLKPVAFNFFPIGSFEYLGFFSKELAEKWAADYRARGNDVHLSEIGGYSTLGWFDDPLYSTQLNWGEYALARLIGHEIAHEKLYFSDDTSFSELMASYIERRLAADYIRTQGEAAHPNRKSIPAPSSRAMPSDAEIAERRRRLSQFLELIEQTKTTLETLYTSSATAEEKRRQKKAILQQLRSTLEHRKSDFAAIGSAQELMKLPEINNAALIQFHRYTPAGENFERLFHSCEKQKNPYVCWFAGLTALKKCSREQRKRWLTAGDLPIKADCEKEP